MVTKTPKFKVGDRVVVTAEHLPKYRGEIYTVTESPLKEGYITNFNLIRLSGLGTMHVNNVTLEEIYKSPLYQALREDESEVL